MLFYQRVMVSQGLSQKITRKTSRVREFEGLIMERVQRNHTQFRTGWTQLPHFSVEYNDCLGKK